MEVEELTRNIAEAVTRKARQTLAGRGQVMAAWFVHRVKVAAAKLDIPSAPLPAKLGAHSLSWPPRLSGISFFSLFVVRHFNSSLKVES